MHLLEVLNVHFVSRGCGVHSCSDGCYVLIHVLVRLDHASLRVYSKTSTWDVLAIEYSDTSQCIETIHNISRFCTDGGHWDGDKMVAHEKAGIGRVGDARPPAVGEL